MVKNTGLHDKRCLINLRLFIFMGHCKFVLKIQYEIKVYDQVARKYQYGFLVDIPFASFQCLDIIKKTTNILSQILRNMKNVIFSTKIFVETYSKMQYIKCAVLK